MIPKDSALNLCSNHDIRNNNIKFYCILTMGQALFKIITNNNSVLLMNLFTLLLIHKTATIHLEG